MIENLLKEIKPYQAPLHFSDQVMKDVEAKEALEEIFLQELKPVSAPPHFSQKVMKKVMMPSEVVDKKAWIYISAACVLFALIAYFTPEKQTFRFDLPDFPNMQFPVVCAMAILGSSLLLLLDQWLRKRLN
jgi:hypothetical protein